MEQTQKHSCLGEKMVWRPGTKQSKQPQRINGTNTENPCPYETTTKTSFSSSTYRSLLDTEIYELRYQPCHLCHTSEVGWYHVRIISWLVGYDDNSPGKSCPEANGHWTHLDAFYLHAVCAIPLAIWHAALRDKIVVITMFQLHLLPYDVVLRLDFSTEDGRSGKTKNKNWTGQRCVSEKKEFVMSGFNRKTMKRTVKYPLWNVALHGMETWTLLNGDMKRLDAFEMKTWRNMKEADGQNAWQMRHFCKRREKCIRNELQQMGLE